MRPITFTACLLVLSLLVSSSPSFSDSLAINSAAFLPKLSHPDVIICGGGPVGLSAALLLANEPHCYDVLVLEQSDNKRTQIDPTKSFQYAVNARGRELHSKFPVLSDLMEKHSVRSGDAEVVTVNSDPKKEPFLFGKWPLPNKELQFISRVEHVRLIRVAIDEHEQDRRQEIATLRAGEQRSQLGQIEVCNGISVLGIEPANTGSGVQIRGQIGGATTSYFADFVIGADGARSPVRTSLESSPLFADPAKGWNVRPSAFSLKKYRSPTTGLRLKALPLPPQFAALDDAREEAMTFKGKQIVSVKSLDSSPSKCLSLGVLPKPNDATPRTANCITRPDHRLWDLKGGEEAREWFTRQFPQLDFSKGGLVGEDDWETFARSEGVRFPYCQYSKGLQASSACGKGGVLLIGDAAHSFPPDCAQGINMGFQDILSLDKELRTDVVVDGDKKQSLGQVLAQYERNRATETRAIVHIARFASPYQYNQSHRMDRFRQKLFVCNFLLRLLLNKVSFGVFPKPLIFTLFEREDLAYRHIARRCGLGTISLVAALSILILKKTRLVL